MQHLPHLTAAIENIVVSPSGSSYAISLANNSVIVISTTELEAKTNIVGVQSRRVDVEQLHKTLSSNQPSFRVFHPVPMAVNPKNPREVLFSVPSSQPRQRSERLCPEPYLQTYDLANQHSVAKQALARNNATDPNMSPEGRRIIEPSVKLLQVSHDGDWLATVDEWIPPKTDMAYLDEGIPEFNEEERTHRREVYLKFWRRDESGQWKLETRIDAPHFFQDVSANGRVFDLVADPTGPGFATVGEDHFVRVWRPKTRLRDGITVRGADTAGLVTWALDRSIEISDKLDVLDVCAGSQQSLPLRASRLAFSADGSVIAAAISWASESDPGVTHLIDANAAVIQRSITEVDVTALSGLAILGRHLIVIGDSITVWDMVLDQLVYCVPINTPGIDLLERVSLVRFAINATDGTFAVSLPQFEKNSKKASSKIIVFGPEQQEALWSTKASGITLGLASRQSERGYVVLDSTSCVRVISPTGSALQLPASSDEVEAAMPLITYAQQTEDMDMDEEAPAVLSGIDDLVLDSAHDEVIIKPEQLQQMFEESGPSHAMGSPSGLFSAIIGLRRGTAVAA
jgi:NET1-associated nuclear protein 1 (U3 small nucleolar RNA-associated protein 17)